MSTDLMLQASKAAPPALPSLPATASSGAAGNVGAAGGASSAAPAQAAVTAPGSSEAAKAAELDAALSKISDYMQNVQRNLTFSVDRDTGETVVKVLDSSTNEVIRQIPSKEALELARRIGEMADRNAKGLLVQSKA